MREGWDSDARSEAPANAGGGPLPPPHPPKTAGEDPLSREIAAVVLAADLDEGLVGALHDPLAADIDPGARGHLAVHHQALAVELVEVLPGGPGRHQVRVGDQHPRRVGVSAENADGLAGLHQQSLVALEIPERGHDAVEALPVPRGAAD